MTDTRTFKEYDELEPFHIDEESEEFKEEVKEVLRKGGVYQDTPHQTAQVIHRARRALYKKWLIKHTYFQNCKGSPYGQQKKIALHTIANDIMCAFMTGKTSEERGKKECDE